MLGDAASLWKTARAAVGRVQDSVSTALENIGGDDEFGAEELESYKEQLAEAQMQHVELSKQMRLLVAEKDAELAVLKGDRSSCSSSAIEGSQEEVIVTARVEIEKAKAESAAMGQNMLELSEKLRAALTENNEAKAAMAKAVEMSRRYEEISRDYKAVKAESKKLLSQKAETIENLVAEYSQLASESELRDQAEELRLAEIMKENEILATKLHVMELNITELADRSVAIEPSHRKSSEGANEENSKVEMARLEELSRLRAQVLGLELDLKESRQRSDGAASAVAEAVETTSAAAAKIARNQINSAVLAATDELRKELEAERGEKNALQSKTLTLSSQIDKLKLDLKTATAAVTDTGAAPGQDPKPDSSEEVKHLRSSLESSQKDNDHLREKVTEITGEAHKLEETLASLKNDEEQQQQALHDMQEKYAALTASMQSKEEEANADLKHARAELDKLTTDVNIKTKALEGFKVKLGEAEAALVKAESEREAAKLSLGASQDDLKGAMEQIESLKSEHVALSTAKQAADAAMAQAKADLSDVEARYERIAAEKVEAMRVQGEEAKQRAVAEMISQRDKFVEKYNKENLLRKKVHNRLLELQGNIRVLCRVRPVLEQERKHAGADVDVTEIPSKQDIIITRDELTKTKFEYDRVFESTSTQAEVFEAVQPLCVSVLDGYNVCIFAYGQTGSGKTYTMEGHDADPGTSPRAIAELFRVAAGGDAEKVNVIEGVLPPPPSSTEPSGVPAPPSLQGHAPPNPWSYSFKFSMLEIYNESVKDLLVGVLGVDDSSVSSGNTSSSAGSGTSSAKGKGPGDRKDLDIRMTKEGGMVVVGITEVEVTTPEDCYRLMKEGQMNRAVGSHDMNEHSSRSHSILTLSVRGKNTLAGTSSFGKLHLIDLAGSERVSKTDASGERLKEAQNINKSLSALGDVIAALGNRQGGGSKSHIPYRNSKLTYLLQDSLGGNSKVLMFVNVSPVTYNVGETVCSLNFASRCRNVELGMAKKNIGKA